MPAWIQFFPEEVQQRFDIVSWDPHGIGDSTGVQCFPNLEAEQAFLGDTPAFPTSREEQRGYILTWAAFGRRCARAPDDVIEHMGTADVARDLELLRRAVGDDELHYWGSPTAPSWGNLRQPVPRACGRAGARR